MLDKLNKILQEEDNVEEDKKLIADASVIGNSFAELNKISGITPDEKLEDDEKKQLIDKLNNVDISNDQPKTAQMLTIFSAVK